MPDQRKNDEVDLLGLLVKMVILIKKNLLLVVLFPILGMAIGVAYFYTSPRIYKSTMIMSSAILTESYSKTLFENINRYIDEGNTGTIALLLDIPQDAAAKVNSLKIENLNAEDELKENDRFIVTVEVSNQDILPQFQAGLIKYLESNNFVKLRVEQNRKFLTQMVAGIEKEIKDMEELKTRIANGEFFQSAKGGMMFDPTSINSKIVDLTEKKIGFQNNLELSNSVQVIEGFSKFEKQIKPRLSASVVGGMFGGILVSFGLIAYVSGRKYLKSAEAAQA